MFAQSCERIKLPDDCTIGFISGEEKNSYSIACVQKSYLAGPFIVVMTTFSIYVMVNFDFKPRLPTVR